MRLTEIKRELRDPAIFTDQDIREDLQWQKWMFLLNTFHMMQLQGMITVEMFEECTECLMFFKPMMHD